MRKSVLLMSCLLLMAVIISCENEEDNKPENVDEVIDVSNDLFNWVYYSFSQEDVVTVTDFSNDLSWDLGIRYENFRTNGGKSGIGQGGVYDLGAVDFDKVNMTSLGSTSSVFIPDDSISVIIAMAMPPVYQKVPGSVPLEDMFLSPTGPTSRTYTPNNHVYVIKTATGKHVKFIGTTFFNDYAQEGFLNFRFGFLD